MPGYTLVTEYPYDNVIKHPYLVQCMMILFPRHIQIVLYENSFI